MTITIKRYYTYQTLYTSKTATTICEAVEEAAKAGVDLSGASLIGAYLFDANLSGANLSGANLSGASLASANLTGANLQRAHLFGANLQRAHLSGADLHGADLYGASLVGANLCGTVMPDGRSWEEYRQDHLADICQTEEVRQKATAAWGKHSWKDCPMHKALGIDSVSQAEDPLAVGCWVALYDAELLPKPAGALNH